MKVVTKECRDELIDIQENTFSILDELKAGESLQDPQFIIIKPNYVIAEHYSKGNTTNPKLLEAIIQYIRQYNDHARVAIGEGGFTNDTGKAFKVNLLPEICRKLEIDLINFNREEKREIVIQEARALKGKVAVARSSVECDLLISVPSLKTHSLATTTLSMKNIMGVLSRKNIMHSHIHQKIVDLFSHFREKLPFAIIDGIIGSDGYECGGTPVQHGILLGSKDLVALDTAGTMAMGIEPGTVGYLNNAMKRGLGECRASSIHFSGVHPRSKEISY